MSLFAAIIAASAMAHPAPLPAAVDRPSAAHGIELIVQQQPGMDASAGLRAAGASIERHIGLIDGLLVRVPAARAGALSAVPGVRAVSRNAAVTGTADNDPDTDDDSDGGFLQTAFNQSIRSDRAWMFGVTGRGVGVAVIDTGTAGDMADFRTSPTDRTSRVAVSVVTNPTAANASDGLGHGTHIAGLIAGNGFNRRANDPLRGNYVGVAPQASLISIKAGDENGDTTLLDVIDGLQFAVDHQRDYNIRVLNLSLSSSVAESHLTDPLDAAVEAAWQAGIVVVAAAGNRGRDDDAVSYAPGNDPWVISVGGVDDMGTGRTRDDELATWSSRGTTQDGYVKPDVLAPGAHLVSTMAPDAQYRDQCPTCVVDGDYFRVGGTSMAAAVASGAVALIVQAHPRWTPDQVKRALTRRTRPVLNRSGIRVDSAGDAVHAPRSATIDGGEVAVDKVLIAHAINAPVPANRGLPLNGLLDPATGALDDSRIGWSRMSWTTAEGPYRPSWARMSWTRMSWTARDAWTANPRDCVDLERMSWTRMSWTRMSWTDADLASAHADCDALLTSIDPTAASWARMSWTRMSWTRMSWTRMSWTSSFAK